MSRTDSPSTSTPAQGPRGQHAGTALWWGCAVALFAGGLALHSGTLDRSLLLQANHALPGWSAWWSGLSVLGLGLSACIVVAALDRRSGDPFGALLFAFPIGSLLTHLPKLFVDSPRPLAALPSESLQVIGQPLLSHSSMPSGHALTAFAVATIVCLTRATPAQRRGMTAVFALFALAVAVGWSRLASAAHWPSDVLAGAGLGIATGLLGHRASIALGLPQRLQRDGGQRAIAVAEAAFAIAMLLYRTGYPDGWVMQGLLAALAATSASLRWQRLSQRSAPPLATREPVATLATAARAQWHAAWRPLLTTGLAVALLMLLLRHADFGALRSALHALPSWAWLAAALGLLGSYAFRAWRLRLEWRRAGLASWLECLHIVLLHNAALALLPLRSGEASYVLLVHRRWGVPLADAARSLLWLRLQDALVLLVLAALLLVPLELGWRIALALALVGVAVLLVPRLLRWGRRRWSRIDRWSAAVLRDRADAAGWVCCAANWLLKLAVVAALLGPLAGIDLGIAWRAALGGEWAAALPLQAPAGLGTYEAGVWAAARLPPPDAARLVAAALAVHAFAIVVLLAVAAASRIRRLRLRTSAAVGAR